MGPLVLWPPLETMEQFSGSHKQRPSLGSFAMILHKPSVMICWESFEGGCGSCKFENHWYRWSGVSTWVREVSGNVG